MIHSASYTCAGKRGECVEKKGVNVDGGWSAEVQKHADERLRWGERECEEVRRNERSLERESEGERQAERRRGEIADRNSSEKNGQTVDCSGKKE